MKLYLSVLRCFCTYLMYAAHLQASSCPMSSSSIISSAISSVSSDFCEKLAIHAVQDLSLKTGKELFKLGDEYENGIGVERDEKRAFELYHAAAQKGYVPAQGRLGLCYRNGTGVVPDKKESLKWLRCASDAGSSYAMVCLGFYSMEDAQGERDRLEALGLYIAAARKGEALAQYYLGICYQSGIVVQQKEEEAFRWFLAAAKQGMREAQYLVGKRYRDGIGVAMSVKKALLWFNRAENHGIEHAQSAFEDLCKKCIAGTVKELSIDVSREQVAPRMETEKKKSQDFQSA